MKEIWQQPKEHLSSLHKIRTFSINCQRRSTGKRSMAYPPTTSLDRQNQLRLNCRKRSFDRRLSAARRAPAVRELYLDHRHQHSSNVSRRYDPGGEPNACRKVISTTQPTESSKRTNRSKVQAAQYRRPDPILSVRAFPKKKS